MQLFDFFPQARLDRIAELLDQKKRWISQDKKGFLRYRSPMEEVAHLRATLTDFSGDVVRIGQATDISPDEQRKVYEILKGFMPWRKGPFSVFDIEIDAEWRSERKWSRIQPHLPDLSGKLIADIGSNNGYYMFRMQPHNPALVLGFEPYVHHYFAFNLLNTFAGCDNLRTELLGIEHLPLFPESFDVIFCMGILYHRPSPIAALQELHSALKPGGTLFIESQAIPGEEPVALFPEQTYAKVPGTWFVPTASCLHNWLTRAGFDQVECFHSHAMSSAEQRKTEWMEFESYEDFIDKDNPTRTIEGYPAPLRIFFKASK
nr:tRNA 5-methoxyuridine(34)/uridine 5-oxyacetic acid(34) synthase CmoB [uncultured Desulfobulbus sp.]